MPAAIRKLFAAIVRLGLTPLDVVIVEASVTNRLSTPQTRPSDAVTESFSLVPMRHVPQA